MKLSKQNCANCKYARPSSFPHKDDKVWLSCRFTPPMPGSSDKITEFKDWRIVPENFWCGKWEEHFD